jgi:protocatechuate 3,4-dioxygenase beta subunit
VDLNGSYDHPNDPGTQNRDRNFQFYGTSVTDEDGLFAFRTIVPARYEPRPRHIHFKVKKDGQAVLTSQFYFTGDANVDEMLQLDMNDTQDANGNAIKLALKDIVIDTGAGGNLSVTPSQQEGPYYPVVDVSMFDNDLASIQ